MLLHVPTASTEIAVGLMSGTSADGIDAVAIRARPTPCHDGSPPRWTVEILAESQLPFSCALSAEIRRAGTAGLGTVDQICRLNFQLGELFALAAQRVIAEASLRPEQVAVIGSHGQTIHHIPPHDGQPGSTLQLGEPAVIAARTGVVVVADFRPADLAVGGQGAPLVPMGDWMMFSSPTVHRAVLNIGGIANLTWLPAGAGPDGVLAFDTGPGNGLIDAAVRRFCDGGPGGCGFDRDGALAARGTVRTEWLHRWLGDPFFQLPPPKSTGLEHFGETWLHRQLSGLNGSIFPPADLVATLTRFTAVSLARAMSQWLPPAAGVPEVLVAGGGAKNPSLLAALAEELSHAFGHAVYLRSTAELGVSVTAREAACFALLALQTTAGLTGNLPSATGAVRPAVLGKLCWPPPPARARVAPPESALPDRGHLLTEQPNPTSVELDRVPLRQAFMLMNQQDATVAAAVAEQAEPIIAAIELVVSALSAGGRLFYVGAGTSGRLGVLDAAECPPTFGTPPEQIQAVIAGGPGAVFRAVEGAEDDTVGGAAAMDCHEVGSRDVVFGIAAGGTTPYVLGALRRAKERGSATVFLACVPGDNTLADICIRPLTGPELLTGSTRLKAGTACKLVLNTVSTLSMVQLGKVLGNRMVDLRATNHKLWDRGVRMLAELTGRDRSSATALLTACHGWVKLALVSSRLGVSPCEARRLLSQHRGPLMQLLERGSQTSPTSLS